MIKEEIIINPCYALFFLFMCYQVSSGLERGGFTFQGDIHGKDFGKFKLERQGTLCTYVVFQSINQVGLQMIKLSVTERS